jgi:hypothetical protein
MVDGASGGRWTYLGELRRRSCGLGKQIGGGTVEPWQERDLKTVVAWTMEWRQERERESGERMKSVKVKGSHGFSISREKTKRFQHSCWSS